MTHIAAAAGPRHRKQAILWAAFAAAQAVVILAAWLSPGGSLYDVNLYYWWMHSGWVDGQWPVLTSDWQYSSWVYPMLAIVPMSVMAMLAQLTGNAVAAWLILSIGASAVVFGQLVKDERRHRAAWFWLLFFAAIGPVGLGRLDIYVAVTVFLALLAAPRRPVLSALFLTVGAWIKVVPGLILWPVIAVSRQRWRSIVAVALVVSAAVMAVVALLGGGLRSLSFLGQQSGRGLQLESVGASLVMISSKLGGSGTAHYNDALNTYEVQGGPTDAIVMVLPAFMVLGLLAIAWLIWRSRGPIHEVLGWGALGMMVFGILTNKVNSTQFEVWLVAPIAYGLAMSPHSRAWRHAAWGAGIAALLSQYLFPFRYWNLAALDTVEVSVLIARNAIVVALAVLTVRQLMRLAGPAASRDELAASGWPVERDGDVEFTPR